MKKIFTLLFFCILLCLFEQGNAQISGTVFRDFNGNGVVENTSTYKEAGISNVIVKAYNASGNEVASVVTSSTGTYSFSGLTFPLRIEFTGLLEEDYDGPAGTSSSTSVQFYTSSSSTANFGVNYPQHYNTSTNPYYFTSQFEANRPPSTEPLATTMLKTQYNSRGQTYSSNTSSIAKTSDIGGTWGVAYDRKNNLLYASAFVKRHAAMKDNDNDGKEDIGAIYSMTQTGSPTLWKDLSTLGIDFGLSLMPTIASRALPTTITGPSHDASVFSLIGKIGIGGIALSDDYSKMYVMNLYDKKIYIINTADQTLLGSSPVVPNSCGGGNSRPFGLKFHRGKIYVGAVCDAATSQSTGDLNATVYSFDGTSFTSVLTFPLNYVKGYTFKDIDDNNFNSIQEEWGSQWNPWSDDMPATLYTTAYTSPPSLVLLNPQPMLVSLEFDVDESLILVFNVLCY